MSEMNRKSRTDIGLVRICIHNSGNVRFENIRIDITKVPVVDPPLQTERECLFAVQDDRLLFCKATYHRKCAPYALPFCMDVSDTVLDQ